MPTFANSFWSPDYRTGVSVIFDKLRQGVAENYEVLTMVNDRIALETAYAGGLQSFPTKHCPTPGGFNRDEGASLRQAYVSFLDEVCNQGLVHAKTANDLERNIRMPFSKWAQGHKIRISESEALVVNKISSYVKKEQKVAKLQQVYFAKCRALEHLMASGTNPHIPLSPTESTSSEGSASTASGTNSVMFRRSIDSIAGDLAKLKIFKRTSLNSEGSTDTQASEANDAATFLSLSSSGSVDLGGMKYSSESLGVLLHSMLVEIPRDDYRVPIIGTYSNVSTGDAVALWVRKRLELKNVAGAEKFGQSLIDHGFLKPVGLVNNRFFNSSTSRYQWQPKALIFEETDMPDRAYPNEPKQHHYETDEEEQPAAAEPKLANQSHAKALREAREADAKYKQEVADLDELRCALEAVIHKTLDYVEQCESDRLRALKKVLLNFAGDLTKNQRQFPIITDRMFLFQESVNPENDLQYLIRSYKTSFFLPKVIIYHNFNPTVILQTYGASIDHTAFVVPQFLDYIKGKMIEKVNEDEAAADKEQTDKTDQAVVTKQVRFAEGYEEDKTELTSLELWMHDEEVPLVSVYQVRKQINTGQPFDTETLDFFPLHTTIRAFKEFLLELPDPVVSFTIYDLIKSVYQQQDLHESERIEAIATAMVQLEGVSITVLKQIVNHFISLSEVYRLDDETTHKLSSALAPCIFRPRIINGFNMDDKHPSLLIYDIFQHHVDLFNLISAKQEKQQQIKRERSVSMSEHNRRAAMEDRNRALTATSAKATPIRNGAADGSPSTPGTNSLSSPNVISSNGLLPLTLSPNSRLSAPMRHMRKISLNMGLNAGNSGGSSSSSSAAGSGRGTPKTGLGLIDDVASAPSYKMVIRPASPEKKTVMKKKLNKELPAVPNEMVNSGEENEENERANDTRDTSESAENNPHTNEHMKDNADKLELETGSSSEHTNVEDSEQKT